MVKVAKKTKVVMMSMTAVMLQSLLLLVVVTTMALAAAAAAPAEGDDEDDDDTDDDDGHVGMIDPVGDINDYEHVGGDVADSDGGGDDAAVDLDADDSAVGEELWRNWLIMAVHGCSTGFFLYVMGAGGTVPKLVTSP